ncbi:hypothetical protein CDD83_1019 [Cordyceps sp. RAO-2017]|nr:hypothetical protein CDD83_1019 [Cordyceps sp. RAO-2017]
MHGREKQYMMYPDPSTHPRSLTHPSRHAALGPRPREREGKITEASPGREKEGDLAGGGGAVIGPPSIHPSIVRTVLGRVSRQQRHDAAAHVPAQARQDRPPTDRAGVVTGGGPKPKPVPRPGMLERRP